MIIMYSFLVALSCAELVAEKNKSIYPDTIASTITFELINKSQQPLAVKIEDFKGQYHIIHADTDILESQPAFMAGGLKYLKIAPNDTLAASLQLDKPHTISIASKIEFTGKQEYPSDVQKYRIDAPKKTIYLSYNADKPRAERLYPQTGPLKGAGKYLPNALLEDRTNSGLLKRNNVDSKDIGMLS